jgi:hypothetical protein
MGHKFEMKRQLVALLSIMIIFGLWMVLLVLDFPLFPCFLWPDFVIYCIEGRLYMS